MTNVSLADSVAPVVVSRGGLFNFQLVYLIIFVIIFVCNVIYVMRNCKLIAISDNSNHKKKIVEKCMIYLVVYFVYLNIGMIISSFCAFATGFHRESNYIDFLLEFMIYAVFISVITLAIIIELISKKKVSNKLVHIVSIIAIALVSSLAIILIVGYYRGDYYNTAYIPCS